MRPISRLWLAAMLLVAGLLLPAACSGGSATSSSRPSTVATAAGVNPSAPGPYPVGVTELTFERTSSTTGEPRDLRTVIWYPAAEGTDTTAADGTLKGVLDAPLAEGKLPLILFSHGSGGMPAQSTYFTAHLASYGFVVVAPAHPGNTIADCFPCTEAGALADSFLNRPEDMRFVLDSVLQLDEDSESVFYDALDATRVGISGHSFGGLDTLELAVDAAPFAAALAMAPPGGTAVPALRGPSAIPIMVMGGGLDTVCPLKNQEAYFDSLGQEVPHFLVVFPKGGHTAYSDICVPLMGACGPDDLDQERAHELVNFYATAFFETYVAKEKGYEAFLRPDVAAGDPDVLFTAVTP